MFILFCIDRGIKFLNCNIFCKHEKDDLYSFSFKPEDSNASQYSFEIMGDMGYIGTLEAKMNPPADHPDFSI